MKKMIIGMILLITSTTVMAERYAVCSLFANGCDALIKASTNGIEELPKRTLA